MIEPPLTSRDELADIRQRHAAPYPGLRPFQQRETELFFGRGEQIDDMLQRLETRRFLAVIGASGSGKSSLVRAGLLPALADGFLSGAQGDWWIATMRPGDDPYRAMAKSLLEVRDRHGDGKSIVPDVPYTVNDVEYTAATLRSNQTGLLTALHDLHVPENAEVLILVDQFEELFRFRRLLEQRTRQQADQSKDTVEQVQEDATAFVNLLLASIRESGRRIHVVLTLRSDYIGDCNAFLGLPEEIDKGQFLTPRMTRRQLQDAIEGPLEAFGLRQSEHDWEPALVNAILNDVGSDPDQLPLMQHALMRTWQLADERRSQTTEKSPGAAPLVPQLTLADYRTVGGFQSALSNHANQTLAGLLEAAADKTVAAERERIVRRMFCLLCDFEPGGRITRRPATLQELLDVTQAPWTEVKKVVAEFAAAGRNFVVVDTVDLESLAPQNTLDISHEALLRQWAKLRDIWLRDERKSETIYKRLADQAERWKQKKAELWDRSDLDSALEWWDRENPSEAWAKRYTDNPAERLRECREFLDASQSKRMLRNFVRVATVFLSLAMGIGIIASVRIWNLRVEAETQRRVAAKEARLARAQQCAAVSALKAARNPVVATILAAEALRGLKDSDGLPPTVEEALRNAVANCTGRPLIGHTRDVDLVAFDPTEQWLATTSGHEILLWSLSDDLEGTRKVMLPLPQTTPAREPETPFIERFVAIGFSAEGDVLAAARENGEYLEWKVGHTPVLIQRHALLEQDVSQDKTSEKATEFTIRPSFRSADMDLINHRLATCYHSGRVSLWTLPQSATSSPSESILGEDANAVKLVPTNSWAVTAGNFIQIWKYDSREVRLLYTLANPSSAEFDQIAVDPHSRFVAAADHDLSRRNAHVYLWDLESPGMDPIRRPRVISTPTASYAHESSPVCEGVVTQLAFSPGGTVLVSGSTDETLRILKVDSYRQSASPPEPSVRNSPDKARDDVTDSRPGAARPDIRSRLGPIRGLAFDPNSRLVIADNNRHVVASSMFDERGAFAMGAVEAAGYSKYNTLAVSSKGRWLVRGDRLWDLRSPIDGISLTADPIIVAAVAPTGEWAAGLCAGGERHYVQLWKIDDQRGPVPAHQLPLPGDFPRLAFSDAVKLFFDRAGKVVTLRYGLDQDLRTGGPTDEPNVVGNFPTRRLAVWSLENVESGAPENLIPQVITMHSVLAWGSCESSVVYAKKGETRLYVTPIVQPRSSPEPATVSWELPNLPENADIEEVHISPDGQWLATIHHKTSIEVRPGARNGENHATLWRFVENRWKQVWTSRASLLNDRGGQYDPKHPAIALGNQWCVVTPRGDGTSDKGVRVLRLDASGIHEFAVMPIATDVATFEMSVDEQRLMIGFREIEDSNPRFGIVELDSPPRVTLTESPIVRLRTGKANWSPDTNWLALQDFDDFELFSASRPASNGRVYLPRNRNVRNETTATLGFNANGSALYTFANQTIRKWPTTLASLLAFTQHSAGRNLDPFEWDEYLPGDKRKGAETFVGLGPPSPREQMLSKRPMRQSSDPLFDGVIRYHIASLPKSAGTPELVTKAWNAWAALGGISPELVTGDGHHVVIRTGPIDGPGGALALSHIGPPSDERILELRFDSEEKWTPELFYATAAHELGHILGLKNSDKPGQLMSPVLDESILVPQDEDKARFREIWKTRLSND